MAAVNDVHVNEHVAINGNLTLDGNVVVPHGTRVKVVGLVPRPTSSDRSWAQTKEDTMYLVVYATTLTSRETFPLVGNNNRFEPSLRVSTTQFVLATTGMAKQGKYALGDIVRTKFVVPLQGVDIPAGSLATVVDAASGANQRFPVPGSAAFHRLAFTRETIRGVNDCPFPFALLREQFVRTPDQTPLQAPPGRRPRFLQ